MKHITSNMHYDEKNDILYCDFGDKTNSYGDENPDNIVIMKDIDTENITGITILNFIKMFQRKDSRINLLYRYFDVAEVIKAI